MCVVKPLRILVDTPTSKHPIADQLRDKGVELVESNLKFEQFRVTDRCGIWFLPADQFMKYVGEKSIFRRVIEFKKTVPEPVVIVDGDPENHRNGVSGAALRSAMAFIALSNHIPILIADKPGEAADLLYIMANQAQTGMGQSIDTTPAAGAPNDNNGNGRPKDLNELQEYILTSLPDVGPSTAKALLKKYRNLKGVFAASAKELTRIPGIGPKKAKRLEAFLSGTLD
ncbi:MAG: hypothetical protein GF341_10915 [candidate division Zixibacteria bacterium]|nr:hypothetical protein [candidate division Zixibacteria bacterium]